MAARSGCRSEEMPTWHIGRTRHPFYILFRRPRQRQTHRKAGAQSPRTSLSKGGGRAAEKESS
jgi:hypothetical protein